jgi:hypothetical protein
MADVNQFTIAHQELLELLIKHLGIHEGQWSLMLGLGVGSGNFGPTPNQTFPGVMVTVNQIGIQRLAPGMPQGGPGSVVVDAAKVNPKKRR